MKTSALKHEQAVKIHWVRVRVEDISAKTRASSEVCEGYVILDSYAILVRVRVMSSWRASIVTNRKSLGVDQ